MVQFNIAWLKEYTGLDNFVVDEVSEGLITQGFENELHTNRLSDKIVVGYVASCEPHPKSDKLSVCSVDIGSSNYLTILCGCPSVKAGIKVACAQVGCVLGEMEITVRSICGMDSHGMLCSQSELGLASTSPGIWHLNEDATVGTQVSSWLQLDATRLDVDVTMNRGDAMSVHGVAREIMAGQNAADKLCTPSTSFDLNRFMSKVAIPVTEGVKNACSHFYLLELDGLDLQRPTPDWIQARLVESGIGLHNICVDILHFVMLEQGQPFHAYDADCVSMPMSLGFAEGGQQFFSLQGSEYTLDSRTLVVKDSTDSVKCIAGYMGDKSSSVTDKTTRIMLEAAYFTPEQIAYQCRRYKDHTQSGSRFERGVDPLKTSYGLSRVCDLLIQYANAKPVICHAYLDNTTNHVDQIIFPMETFDKVLGEPVEMNKLIQTLFQLGYRTKKDANNVLITRPSWRHDVTLPQHIVTEYVRFHGVPDVKDHSVPAVLSRFSGGAKRLDGILDSMYRYLMAYGGFEVYHYNFLNKVDNKDFIENEEALLMLANPLGATFSSLRATLFPGLLHAMSRNIAHGINDTFLFESGYCYRRSADEVVQDRCLSFLLSGDVVPERWREKSMHSDFFTAQGLAMRLLQTMRFTHAIRWEPKVLPGFHPGQCGCFFIENEICAEVGTLHPHLAKKYHAQSDVQLVTLYVDKLIAFHNKHYTFQEINRKPSMRRDLSLLLPKKVSYGLLYDKILQFSPSCLKNVILFDIYSGSQVPDDFYSLSVGIIFHHESNSLTDEEVSGYMKAILVELEKLQITVRGG